VSAKTRPLDTLLKKMYKNNMTNNIKNRMKFMRPNWASFGVPTGVSNGAFYMASINKITRLYGRSGSNT